MYRTWSRAVGIVLFVMHGLATLSAAPSVKEEIDSFFVGMKADFDKIAGSAILRRPAVGPVSAYFLKQLKSRQPYYSLIRTDAKGMTVNEVVRLVTTPFKKRDVSGELWFKQVKSTQKEYAGRVKLEETGRYYLVWAAPIIREEKSGKREFMGAVMLMVDLWDCFQRFSKVTTAPFLVRMGHLHLYSHNWSDTIGYVEEALTIPGVKRIFVRSAEEPPPPDTLSVAMAVAESVQAAAPQKKKSGAGGWIALLLIVVVLETTVLAFYVVKPLAALREKWFAAAKGEGGFY